MAERIKIKRSSYLHLRLCLQTAFRSAAYRWSCCRYNVNNAWNFNVYGFANNNNFYDRWRVGAVSAFRLIRDMVAIEDLYKVYYMARANKRRSHDAVAFEVSLESNLDSLCRNINECTYRAHGNYTFVSTYPVPREIFGCEMAERIVQWYILWRITPLLEAVLVDGLCSNRFRHLGNFIATLNSYFGRMKNRNEYSNIRRLWESIDAGRYRYVKMDWDRLCVVAREECSHHRYNMKLFKTITNYERK